MWSCPKVFTHPCNSSVDIPCMASTLELTASKRLQVFQVQNVFCRCQILSFSANFSLSEMQEGVELFPKNDAGEWQFSDIDYLETWGAMEDAVKQGLTKSIGTSNFNKAQIQRIIDNGTIPPANLQVTLSFTS